MNAVMSEDNPLPLASCRSMTRAPFRLHEGDSDAVASCGGQSLLEKTRIFDLVDDQLGRAAGAIVVMQELIGAGARKVVERVAAHRATSNVHGQGRVVLEVHDIL